MERHAIDQSEGLGSFYNAYQDRITQIPNQKRSNRRVDSFRAFQQTCQLIRGDTLTTNQLLTQIGIEDELRLSLLLSITAPTGITQFVSEDILFNQFTRILYYSLTTCTQQYPTSAGFSQNSGQSVPQSTDATHRIIAVTYGVELLIIFQSPSNAEALSIMDRLLDEIRKNLIDEGENSIDAAQYQHTLNENEIMHKIYSNVPDLTPELRISDVLTYISHAKKDQKRQYPLKYRMERLQTSMLWFFKTPIPWNTIDPPLLNKIGSRMCKIQILILTSADFCKKNRTEELEEILEGIKAERIQYASVVQRQGKLVMDARKDSSGTSALMQYVESDPLQPIQERLIKIKEMIKKIENKRRFIESLNALGFEYHDAKRYSFEENLSWASIQTVLQHGNPRHIIVCSTDSLIATQSSAWNQLHQQLVKQKEENPVLTLIYIDFSASSISLSNILVFRSKTIVFEASLKTNLNHLSTIRQDIDPLPKVDPVRVLVLGESGIGKSTFINAFHNYLVFSSVEVAQANELQLCIPVSFIMMVGNDGHEQLIVNGENDDLQNEHFNDQGACVTQQCRSHTFHIPCEGGQQQICLIDTPGFGDGRGLEQDEKNTEHILQYIAGVPSLDALCFLLETDESKVNMCFRRFVSRLFSSLDRTAPTKVIFCLTRTGRLLYDPSRVMQELRKMFLDLNIEGIPLSRETIFRLDGEPIRYLVARQRNVEFSEEEEQYYQTNWRQSVGETYRLMDYIHRKRTGASFPKKNDPTLIEAIKDDIRSVIPVMLEIIRNLFRNLILYLDDSSNDWIQMHTVIPDSISSGCPRCPTYRKTIGRFWIDQEVPHLLIGDECVSCPCSPRIHTPLTSVVRYRCVPRTNNITDQQIINDLETFWQKCVTMNIFFLTNSKDRFEDPLSDALKEMVVEESYLDGEEETPAFNRYLNDCLYHLLTQHQAWLDEWQRDAESIFLSQIQALIEQLKDRSLFHELATTRSHSTCD